MKYSVVMWDADGNPLRVWAVNGVSEEAAEKIRTTQVTRYRRDPDLLTVEHAGDVVVPTGERELGEE